jgi:hypothetical protein
MVMVVDISILAYDAQAVVRISQPSIRVFPASNTRRESPILSLFRKHVTMNIYPAESPRAP